MKIIKYKKLKSLKYEVVLENNTTIELYEDTILKYNLLISMKIKEEKLHSIIEYNKKFDSYYQALKYINVRVRSKKEIETYLLKKEYNKETINEVIDKLESQGYLNDLVFAKSFVNNKLITTSNGPSKITRELSQYNIGYEDTKIALEQYTKEIQIEKINKHINRIIKSNRNRGNICLKQKILIDLQKEGFDKSLVVTEMNKIDLPDDSSIAKKEYQKLYNKLSRKYSGKELELKIKQKLYQKGFTNIDI